MAEKRKWFDPRQKPEEPLRLLSSGGVIWPDAVSLREFVQQQHEHKRLPDDTYKLFVTLCDIPPAARLSRNLKVVLTVLAEQPLTSVLTNGLTETEKLALLDLEHLHAPPTIRAIAQGLLNVRERQQLADALQEMYRDERTRRWRSEPER
jgi:hypothetical protein